MTKKIILISMFYAFQVFSTASYAGKNNCELPPGIDDDKRYLMKIDGVNGNKEGRWKILEIEDCWIQTFRKNGDHIWFPINRIIFINTNGTD